MANVFVSHASGDRHHPASRRRRSLLGTRTSRECETASHPGSAELTASAGRATGNFLPGRRRCRGRGPTRGTCLLRRPGRLRGTRPSARRRRTCRRTTRPPAPSAGARRRRAARRRERSSTRGRRPGSGIRLVSPRPAGADQDAVDRAYAALRTSASTDPHPLVREAAVLVLSRYSTDVATTPR